MSAEIVSFAEWQRRPVPCHCRHCVMVEISWHRFGAKQPLADFLAEHSLYPRDKPSVALAIIADKARSRLARAQARTILAALKDVRAATPDDAA